MKIQPLFLVIPCHWIKCHGEHFAKWCRWIVTIRNHLLGTMNIWKQILKILASICWNVFLWSNVLDRLTDITFLRQRKNNTVKDLMAYFLSFFSLVPPFFSPEQFKNSNHCPTRIVIFWQSPRKNYIFLCLSGSCLLFFMWEGKKWVGVPPQRVCGRLDDMVGEGMALGPLGGKGREGVEILMHHRFLPLSLILLSQ